MRWKLPISDEEVDGIRSGAVERDRNFERRAELGTLIGNLDFFKLKMCCHAGWLGRQRATGGALHAGYWWRTKRLAVDLARANSGPERQDST